MKSGLAIVIFMLFFVFSLYRKARKQYDNSRPTKRQPVSVEKDAAGQVNSDEMKPDGVDDLGEPYFSYESEESLKRKAQKTSSRPQPSMVRRQPQPAVAGETPPRQFDLRQAVIYQTVLDNPYVSEINQSIQ